MTSMLRLYSRSGSCVQIDLLDNSGRDLCSLGQAAHRLRDPEVRISPPIVIGIALRSSCCRQFAKDGMRSLSGAETKQVCERAHQ